MHHHASVDVQPALTQKTAQVARSLFPGESDQKGNELMNTYDISNNAENISADRSSKFTTQEHLLAPWHMLQQCSNSWLTPGREEGLAEKGVGLMQCTVLYGSR